MGLLSVALGACSPPPERVVAELAAGLGQGGRWPRVARAQVSEAYRDPRGGRAALIEELGALLGEAPGGWRLELSGLRPKPGLSARRIEVQAELSARWDGRPSWRARGPVRIELDKTERWRVVGGFLWQLRDARALVRAWQDATRSKDAPGLRALLHDGYGQGADPEAAVRAALRSPSAPPLAVRLELRAGGAHLDLFRRGQRPLRWTLRSQAGRLKIWAGPLGGAPVVDG